MLNLALEGGSPQGGGGVMGCEKLTSEKIRSQSSLAGTSLLNMIITRDLGPLMAKAMIIEL